MGVRKIGWRHHPLQLEFNLEHIFAWCQASAVGDPENMGIDGNRRLAESRVEHDIGGLASYPGQGLERGTIMGYFTVVLFQQDLTGFDDVAGLGAIEAYCFDLLA